MLGRNCAAVFHGRLVSRTGGFTDGCRTRAAGDAPGSAPGVVWGRCCSTCVVLVVSCPEEEGAGVGLLGHHDPTQLLISVLLGDPHSGRSSFW